MRVSLSPWSNEPEGVRRLSYGALIRRAALPGTAALFLLAVACGGSSDTSDSTAAVSAPAGDELTPSTSATATVTTGEMRCTPGLAIADQKAVLVAIVKEQLSGTTSHDSEMPHLEIDPDPRDHRQGGIWIVMEFNGDEFDSVEGRPVLLVRLGNAGRGWVPNGSHFAGMRKQLKRHELDKKYNVILYHFGVEMEVVPNT